MKISATGYRILKYLSRNKSNRVISPGLLYQHIYVGTGEELNTTLESLVAKGFIKETKSDVEITPAGNDYLLNIEDKNKELAYEDVFDDYDYSVLKYLYVNDWGIRINEFPAITFKEVPDKETIYDESNLTSYLYSKRPYIDNINDCYKLNEEGKRNYLFLTKKKIAEKEAAVNQNKSMSADNINYFANGGTVGDMFIKNDIATKTISTIQQKPSDKKWIRVIGEAIVKAIVNYSIPVLIGFAIGLFTGAKSCNHNALQNQIPNTTDSLTSTK